MATKERKGHKNFSPADQGGAFGLPDEPHEPQRHRSQWS